MDLFIIESTELDRIEGSTNIILTMYLIIPFEVLRRMILFINTTRRSRCSIRTDLSTRYINHAFILATNTE